MAVAVKAAGIAQTYFLRRPRLPQSRLSLLAQNRNYFDHTAIEDKINSVGETSQ